MSLPITAIILTNRADQRLERCLASVSWAKQIVIVDDQTGTEWSSWKKKWPLKVEVLPAKLKDFAEARNFALTLADQEWVLFVDSDEVVTPASLPEIEKALASDVDGVLIKRTDIFHGRHLHWGEVRNVKLLRLGKKSVFKFERPVHEIGVIKGKVIDSEIEFLHFSHLSISDFLSSVTAHSQREAVFRVAQGQSFSWWQMMVFPVGKALYNLVINRAFLDGWAGIVYVVMMSLHSLMVRVFVYEKSL